MSFSVTNFKNQYGEFSSNYNQGGSSGLSCKFSVTPTNGAGITNLASSGVASVFMHTSTTPVAGNPNPAVGLIQVQLSKPVYPYQSFNMARYDIYSPASGSNLAVSGTNLTAGKAYVITVLGTSTAADWLALGLSAGLTPTVGQGFVAIATGAGSGSGQVQLTSVSGIDGLEIIADPNQSLAPTGAGSVILLQCTLNGTATAPAAGTGLYLSFNMSGAIQY